MKRASAVLAASLLGACGGDPGVTASVELALASDPGIARLQVALVAPPASVDCGDVTTTTCLRDHLHGNAPTYSASAPFDAAAAGGAGQTLSLRGISPRAYAVVVEGLDAATPPKVVATACLATADVQRPVGGGPVTLQLTLATNRTIACADPRLP
jgi:hypothetical protein